MNWWNFTVVMLNWLFEHRTAVQSILADEVIKPSVQKWLAMSVSHWEPDELSCDCKHDWHRSGSDLEAVCSFRNVVETRWKHYSNWSLLIWWNPSQLWPACVCLFFPTCWSEIQIILNESCCISVLLLLLSSLSCAVALPHVSLHIILFCFFHVGEKWNLHTGCVPACKSCQFASTGVSLLHNTPVPCVYVRLWNIEKLCYLWYKQG